MVESKSFCNHDAKGIYSSKINKWQAEKTRLEQENIEGIVFHDGERMCKIRKTDFGIKRG